MVLDRVGGEMILFPVFGAAEVWGRVMLGSIMCSVVVLRFVRATPYLRNTTKRTSLSECWLSANLVVSHMGARNILP